MSAILETVILALILALALIALLRRLAPGPWAALLRRLGLAPPAAPAGAPMRSGCGAGCSTCGGCSAAPQWPALKRIPVQVEPSTRPSSAESAPRRAPVHDEATGP